MSDLSKEDIYKLEVMYEGDKNRDASNKIRGFLFQDYVTIMCLLKDNVKCVCSEYIEDIDVFYEDGRFEIIQVKYYPKTSPDRKEILTDLYYQFLRLKILGSSLKAVPSLYIHRDGKNNKPTLEEIKSYIVIKNGIPNTYSDDIEAVDWLKDNVYAKKKEEQKKILFNKMAAEDSIKEFIAGFNISKEDDINTYKGKLMGELAKEFPNPDNEEKWKLILLGLAIVYIQKRYNSDNQNFEQLRINKEEFIEYIKDSVKTRTNQTIASYLVSIACDEYWEIISKNELSDLQANMLNTIYKNTVKWISKIGETVEGQYKILNTCSLQGYEDFEGYKQKNVDARLVRMAECKEAFTVFLDYLWKIILNICQEKVYDMTGISDKPELFDPYKYIDDSITEYVCFNFPEDKSINYSIILPPVGGKFKRATENIVERMLKISQKPEKWFFENSKVKAGKNYYNYSTADVNEDPTVADLDLGKDIFYIKCMDCIKIDKGEWKEKETCGNCIFSDKCVNEGI